MTDFLLTSGDDLDLGTNELQLVTDRSASVAQHIKIRLRFFLGEWFLDRNLGVPYFERILVKNPDLITVSKIFQEAILETAGVESLASFDMSVDNASRNLNVTFKAILTDADELLDFSDVINISEIL